MAYSINPQDFDGSLTPVRMCQFFDCDNDAVASLDCPAPSEAAISPDGQPGCCSNEFVLSVTDISCGGVGEATSGQVYIRVDMQEGDGCVYYDLGFHC